MRLLDTDVMVDVRRRHPPAVAWLRTLTERPGLPGLVVMELVEGCPGRARGGITAGRDHPVSNLLGQRS